MQSMDWADADMVNQKAAELGFKDDWFLDPMESKKRQDKQQELECVLRW